MKDLALHFFTLPIDKRIRIILYVFQSIFSIVFASYLYKYFVGSFKFIEITDYQALIDFIITGRFLFCLFFFVASWLIFYNIGYFIILWLNKKIVEQIVNLIWKWFKRKAKESDKDIDEAFTIKLDELLVKIGAVELTEDAKKTKGKKYNAYFRISNHLKELSSDKRYLMPFLILMMLLQFTLIYFNSFANEVSSLFLEFIIVIIFLGYLLSFFLTVFTLELLVKLGNLVENRLQNI